MEHDFVLRDRFERDAFGCAFDCAFDAFVGEWFESSALVADEVVVVPAAVADGFEAADAGTDLDALDDADLFEFFEDPVDAGA